MERRLRVLVEQVEEERAGLHQKMDEASQRLLALIGGKLTAATAALTSFLRHSANRVDRLEAAVAEFAQRDHGRLLALQEQLEGLREGVRAAEEAQVGRECCSAGNTSKDTASHNSSLSSNRAKQDLFLSDYFFHPAEADNPSIRAVE